MSIPGPNDPGSAYPAQAGGAADLTAVQSTPDTPRALAIYGDGDANEPLVYVEGGQSQNNGPVDAVDFYVRTADDTERIDLFAWPGPGGLAGLVVTGPNGYVALNADDTAGQRVAVSATSTQTYNPIEVTDENGAHLFDVPPAGGIVLHSPNGTAYHVTVANDGTLTTTAV